MIEGRKQKGGWTAAAVALVCGIVVLGGCAGVEKASKRQKQRQQFLSYDHVIRWGDLEEMYAYGRPGSEPVTIQGGLDKIRVTNLEEVGPVLDAGDGRVSRKIRVEYVLKDRQVVRTLIDEQIWEYDEQSEQWFRVNRPPTFE